MAGRESIGAMPYRRRCDGFCAQERQDERHLWAKIGTFIALLAILPVGPAQVAVLGLIAVLSATAHAMRHLVWAPHAPVNPANRNRGIASFSPEECWNFFRFRKADLPAIIDKLGLPKELRLKGEKSGHVNGESASLYLLYRLHYPQVLNGDQDRWGHEYSTLSRIFNTALDEVYRLHEAKVCGNVDWYQDRFDLYNRKININFANNQYNPFPGMIHPLFNNLFGFLDGCGSHICRPGGPGPLQNAFWNRYFHAHILIYQGITFPDGLLIVEGPEPGFETDWIVWRNCLVRHQIEQIMQTRVANNQRRLKLYGDKMYWNDPIITAAFNNRNGFIILPWMRRINLILSGARVSIEWTFGKLLSLFKFTDYVKTQSLFLSPLAKQFKVSVLLLNAHTCIYGSQTSEYFDCDPPTLDDYFNQ